MSIKASQRNNPRPASKLAGPLLVFAAALFWSTSGLLVKLLPWPAMAISSVRSMFALALYLSIFRSSIWRMPSHPDWRVPSRPVWRIPNRWTWISGISLIITQTLFVLANKMTTATNAIFLQYFAPIFVIGLNFLIDRIKPQRREIVTIVIALGGFALFFLDDLQPGNLVGNILAIVSGISFATMIVANHRPQTHIPTTLVIGQLGCVLIGLPAVMRMPLPPLSQVLIAAALGIFQLGVGYLLFSKGLQRTEPLNASLISMAEPLANPVWVYLVLGEKPGSLAGAGAAIVLAAVVGLNWFAARAGSPSDTTP